MVMPLAVAADLKTLDGNMTPEEVKNLHRLAHKMRKKARLDVA